MIKFQSYSEEAFEADTSKLIRNARTQLIGQSIDFDCMVGIGMSGLLVLPTLARHFKVPFLALRKPGDSSHMSSAMAHGTLGSKWILIDDFSQTGETIQTARKIVDTVAHLQDFKTTYQGTYCYGSLGFSRAYGEFINPQGKPRAVVACQFQGETVYAPWGEFTNIKDDFNQALEATGSKVRAFRSAKAYAYRRFSYLDDEIIEAILDTIILTN
jgi:hypothetical protein